MPDKKLSVMIQEVYLDYVVDFKHLSRQRIVCSWRGQIGKNRWRNWPKIHGSGQIIMIFSSEYFILDISLWIFLKKSDKKEQKMAKNGQKLINIFWNVDIKINGLRVTCNR